MPAALVLCYTPLLAADKSGVSPNSISLPKGPGSIEGLGESFQPSLNTGTAKYSVRLKLPPGTAGQAPELSLAYEGGGGNGPLGYGWQLPLPYVQRQTDEGIPTYGEDLGVARQSVFINENKEELVPVEGGNYFSRNEGAFVRYRRIGDYWEGTLPNGTRQEFGSTSEGRVQDTNGVAPRVFACLLQRESDTHGNTIVYSWREYPGNNNTRQKYLSGIAYGPGAPPWNNFHFVQFLYEDRPDWFEDCRSGFPVRTGKRLKTILVGTQGPDLTGHLAGDFNQDGQPDYLDWKYELAYADFGPDAPWSLLSSVQQVGAMGVNRLPASTFDYTVCNPPAVLDAGAGLIGGLNEPSTVMDNESVDLLDLNGDGLPDVLRTYEFGGGHVGYLNLGESRTNEQRRIRWSPAQDIEGDPQASLFWLSQASVHLADMDGDGLADLVAKTADEQVQFYPSLGNVAWGARKPMATGLVPPPAPFGDLNVRTADLDFDKRIDLIRGDGSGYQVWFNLGGLEYSERVSVVTDAPIDLGLPGVHVADLNGDRVPDIARVRTDRVEFTAGLGYGRFTATRSIPIPDINLDEQQVNRCVLADITGDGLPDLILERAAPGHLWFWINLGNDSFSLRKTIVGLPTAVGDSAVIRWADMNGNSTTDLVYADSASAPRIQTIDIGELFTGGIGPNTLVRISNGIGRVTTIGYTPSTEFALSDAARGVPWTSLMPNPISVVSSVTNSDSLGHQYVTQFRYHDGYYEPTEKQFRGFARVERIDVGDASAPTLVTRSLFDTGREYEPMKGKLLAAIAEQEDGKVFWVETNAYSRPPVVLYTGTNQTNVTYVHPVARRKVIKELDRGTPRTLEFEFAYDRYGNQTTNAEFGIVENADRSAFDDERITVTDYAINTNSWILRLPSRTRIADEHGTVISQTEFYYDDPAFSVANFGKVTVGNQTMKLDWPDPAQPSAFVISSRAQFDAYGNSVVLLDPLGHAAGGTADYSQGHARQIRWDPLFHSYPIEEVIHLGGASPPLTFQAAYDVGFGVVLSSIDFNSHLTSYGYDEFARLTSIIKPGDSPAYPATEYQYGLGVPFNGSGIVNFVETRQLDKSPGSLARREDHYFFSRQYVDGLGRKLMAREEGTEQASDGLRVTVTGTVSHNARQGVSLQLNPFYSTRPAANLQEALAYEAIESPGWTGQFADTNGLRVLSLAEADQTRTRHDSTLRVTETENADHTVKRTEYEPLLTRYFDENDTDPGSTDAGTPSVQRQDGLGRLVQVEELTHLNDDGTPSGSLQTWTTRYTFDLNDQLTRIVDAQDNVRTFVYDGLKRKTRLSDPDRGVMLFAYDPASNLTNTIDAKGQSISYTYDGANRIQTELYQNGLPLPLWRAALQGSTNASVVYHYDVPKPGLPQGDGTTATARNVKGALAWVEDLSGEEHNSYDERGRTESVVKRIADPLRGGASDALTSYKTAFGYDAIDRLTRLTYPDLDEVQYEYNDRGLLRRILGGSSGNIVSNIAYQPSTLQTRISYGNGVVTSQAYDRRLRLKNLRTQSGSATLNADYINLTYEMDGVSNITLVRDTRPEALIPNGDPRRNTQKFRFDDLYRLTRVQYSFALPGSADRNDGEVDYRYDRIGNMLSQTSTISEERNGTPVVNLGLMDSGGSNGRSGRTGRLATDPPGPHALTTVRDTQGRTREVAYDANGNVMLADGMACTWDFKDRLVAVENSDMRAAYTYDYTDRRITKRVFWKRGEPVGTNQPPSVAGGPTTTSVSYVNKFFEVREHDAPVKYVWNANTRVARVSSSLLTNARVQRLRLSPGWNLCSLAVSAEAALQQMHDSQPPLLDAQSARRWNSATLSWIPVSEQESLAAGTVLWIHARTNATVSLTGTYAAPGEGILSATTGFWPNAGFESWDLAALPAALQTGSAWVYDASDARWSSLLPANLAPPGNLPSSLGPGQAVFFASSVPVQIQMPPTSSRICYFHQDHVGSTAVVTDAQGNVVQETALFPFGVLRHEGDQTRRRLPYQFAQKERDAESSLDYFESRFLNASFGRFLSADPALGSVTSQTLSNPQLQHAYAYGANNPLRFLDADGRKPSPVKAKSGIKIGGGSVSLDREGNVGISVGKAQVEINSKKQISKVKLGPVEVDQKGAKVQVGVASVGFSNEGKKLEYTATAGATFEAGLGEQAKVEATAEVEAGLAIEPSGREDEAYKALYGGVDRPEKFTLFARAKAKFKALFNMGGTEHEVEAEETAETESSYNPLQGVQNNYMRALNASKSD